MGDSQENSGGKRDQNMWITITYVLILGLGVLNLANFGWKLLDETFKLNPLVGLFVGVIFLAIPIFAAFMLGRKR